VSAFALGFRRPKIVVAQYIYFFNGQNLGFQIASDFAGRFPLPVCQAWHDDRACRAFVEEKLDPTLLLTDATLAQLVEQLIRKNSESSDTDE
jgi:hypothetical protein